MLFSSFFSLYFFLLRNSSATVENPILYSSVEVGLQSLGAFYQSEAMIRVLTSSELQILADSDSSELSSLRYAHETSCFLFQYRIPSMIPFSSDPLFASTFPLFLQDEKQLKIPYLNIHIQTRSSTTSNYVSSLNHFVSFQNLSREESQKLYHLADSNPNYFFDFNISFPLALWIPFEGDISFVSNISRRLDLQINQNQSLSVLLDDGFSDIHFLNPTLTSFYLLVWSQPVSGRNVSSANLAVIGIYILLLFVITILFRNNLYQFSENLWKQRMHNVLHLYQMVLAAEAFRTGSDFKKEKSMTEQVLEIFRSYENVIQLTDSQK